MRKMSVEVVGVLAAGLLGGCVSQETRTADTLPAYIGPYTGGSGSKGIYRIWVDREKGIVSKPELVAEVDNPSFLAFGEKRYNASGEIGQTLYAVSESQNKVFAYHLEHVNSTLMLNAMETGAGPCHVAVNEFGLLTVANYGGGSMNAWWLKRDGSIGESLATFQNTYASKATNRQQKPHAHGVTFMTDQACLLVPDLGADRVYVYFWWGAKGGGIQPHPITPWIELPPGRGPRHVKFSPDGQNHLYVLNELSNTVSVFDTKNLFTFIEEVSTLPAGFDGQSTSAELVFSPDGKTLYTSNRGHDSIARFTRDPKTGRLKLVECVPCGGKCPRDFSLMPGGGLMLVANQNSNNIAVFRVAKDGALKLLPDAGVDIGAPVCVQFE